MRSVIIDKLVAGLSVQYTASSGLFSIRDTVDSSGWEMPDANAGSCFWRGYIDLAGLRQMDEVFVPTDIDCQLGGGYGGQGASVSAQGGSIFVQYALTTDRLDDLTFGTGGVGESLGGFIGDNTDFQQIIMGATNTYGPAINSILYSNIASYAYGNGIPVVTDRIYVAIRLQPIVPFVSGSATDAVWVIPPKRFMLVGQVGDIPDHEMIYLMAQQYEAQKRIDVT